MIVHIPGQLRSYTGNAAQVEAQGTTVAAVLADLERQYTGIRFRIVDEQDRLRPHMKLYVTDRWVRKLSEKVTPDDEIHVLGALSGG